MDGRRGLKQCWPFGLAVGASFGVTKWIVSATPLYNLTEVFATGTAAQLHVRMAEEGQTTEPAPVKPASG